MLSGEFIIAMMNANVPSKACAPLGLFSNESHRIVFMDKCGSYEVLVKTTNSATTKPPQKSLNPDHKQSRGGQGLPFHGLYVGAELFWTESAVVLRVW